MTRRLGVVIGLGLAITTLSTARAETSFEGRVVKVFDGDTIEVLVGDERRRIRLAGIDAPERGQPWSQRSRQALAARVVGKQVRINAVDTDRYGRIVGEVYADDVCVNCELTRAGHVWAYRYYDPDPIILELEDEARAAERGLWGLPESERIPPWEWRRGRRNQRAPQQTQRAQGCADKSRCAQMRDCAEARFYLRECGVDTLDGDRDGVPCEALCRD